MGVVGFLLVCVLTHVFSALATNSSRYIIRESLSAPPTGFKPLAQVSVQDGTSLQLFVVLPQKNITGLHDVLLDVSNPDSPNYGHYWNRTQVDQLIGPDPESLTQVTSWFKAQNVRVTSNSPTSSVLKIHVPITQANSLFNADFKSYLHVETQSKVVRTLRYAVPVGMDKHISFIYPATQFRAPLLSRGAVSLSTRTRTMSAKPRAEPLPNCTDNKMTPMCLSNLYKIPLTMNRHLGNRLAVGGLNGGIPDYNDVDNFMKKSRPDHPSAWSLKIAKINGGGTGSDDNFEVSLDSQFAVGLATNVSVIVANIPSEDALTSFIDLATWLLQQDSPPLVLSTSYGVDEADVSSSADFRDLVCNAYAALGLRGVSVLFASGDGGVAGMSADGDCHNSDGTTQFIPTFPSTCPYVTSVGSTTGIQPETAADFSAGGFSNVYERPDYQKSAVEEYLETLGPTQDGLFNPSMRAYPDISAQGTNFGIVVNGTAEEADGTSASTPTVASIIALLNNKLLDAGKPPLGFLNPLLYSRVAAAGALNDITTGSNTGCGMELFPAKPGWDPVTGLGTPDYEKLLDVVMGNATTNMSYKGAKLGAKLGAAIMHLLP